MRNAILLIVAVTVLGISDASACSCAPNDPSSSESVQEHVEYADLIFLGKVETKETAATNSSSDGAIIEMTTFYVLDSWKGEKANRIITKINVRCCICGASFTVGETYLVFAYERDDGFYTTSICTMTMPKSMATDTIGILNELASGDTKSALEPDN